MAYQLKADEMLDALSAAGIAGDFVARMEALADDMANALCAANPGLSCDKASFQGSAFAGTCVPFYGTDLPDMIEGYDDPDEFCTR